MNTPQQDPTERLADAEVEGQAGTVVKSFRLTTTKHMTFSKVLLGIMFVAGFVTAVGLIVNTKIGKKYAQTSLAAQICSNTSVNATPLNDLGAGMYMGQQGGLYPGGSNVIPNAHLTKGVSIAATIQPLNGSGQVDLMNGKIGLISMGVSNTRNKFEGCDSGNEGNCATNSTYPNAFKPRADVDPDKNSKVIIISGAQGSRPLSDWNSDTSTVWSTIDSWLSAAGLTPLQVQSAWVELPDKGYTTVFPDSELEDKGQLENVLRIAKTKYPNLKIAYLSSRTYGGYSDKTSTNIDDESIPGKLHAYQSAWVQKWIIEDQINGVGNINPDPDGNPATSDGVAPWVAWGPYFWADGTIPRSDGLTWVCSDFNSDGVHPNNQGVKKVADRLLTHFKTDLTACPWFLAAGCGVPGNHSPIAQVGADQTVTDTDGNGTESVTLDGSTSTDPDGTIVSYEWKEGTTVLGTSAMLSIDFSIGIHTVTLTVTDNVGAQGVDMVMVTVNPVSQGITFDAASSANMSSSKSSSFTWSHATGSGINRALIVGVSMRNDNSQTVSSVKYNDISLIKVKDAINGTKARAELWRLVNPPSGTYSVVVTLSSPARFVAGATSYAGVNQITPLGAAVSATGTNAVATVNVGSSANELVVDVVASRNSSFTLVPGSGQTQAYQQVKTNSTSSNNVRGGGSNESGTASVTMSWILSGNTDWALVAVPLKP